jgi:arylsulfatase A
MDEAIGRLMDLLDRYGVADHTLVIFLSDNGGGSGVADNGLLRGGKSVLFEGGVGVSGAFLTTLEIVPTVLALAGVEPPGGLVLDGFDMMPVLADGANSPRQEMFWQRRDHSAARIGHWKWVDTPSGGGLFDLSQDVAERRDLSTTHPEKLEEMKSHFDRWAREMAAAEPRGPFRDY